jgi:cytochrome c oxidase subunit II
MKSEGHFTRVIVIWVVLAIIADLLIGFLLAPHMPPGRFSNTASDQTEINIFLALLLAPVAVGVITFFVYSLAVFRQPAGELQDGPPVKGNSRVQTGWVVTTTVIVLALAIVGTAELLESPSSASGAGAGGGQGATPISVPSGNPLQVQVIAQQWWFTYRYPQYGGIETFSLALPVGRTVEFHVTSLDVIHSFWAYQLGVKADAVPGADNIAFTIPKHRGLFQVRCAELCGLYHGYMAAHGEVLSARGFNRWIHRAIRRDKPIMKYLPKYRLVYYPQPYGRGG